MKSKWTYPAQLNSPKMWQEKAEFRKHANRVKKAAKRMFEMGATSDQIEHFVREVLVELVHES